MNSYLDYQDPRYATQHWSPLSASPAAAARTPRRAPPLAASKGIEIQFGSLSLKDAAGGSPYMQPQSLFSDPAQDQHPMHYGPSGSLTTFPYQQPQPNVTQSRFSAHSAPYDSYQTFQHGWDEQQGSRFQTLSSMSSRSGMQVSLQDAPEYQPAVVLILCCPCINALICIE